MFEIYKVGKGDTLETIADSFNISLANLYEINGFNPDILLEESMNIIVPKKKNEYFTYYTIEKGDTLTKIANKYDTNPNLLAILNGLNIDDYIYPNQTIVIPNKNVNIYITKEKDTINEIIGGIGTTPDKLISQNPKIYVIPDQIIIYKQN